MHPILSWIRSLSRLLAALSIGITVWYVVFRWTVPQPHHAVVPGVLEVSLFGGTHTSNEPQPFRFDSTGWWIAVKSSGAIAGIKIGIKPHEPHKWRVYNLLTGEVRTHTWQDAMDSQSWAPLPQGYRHTREASDGGIEVVDTSFVDGISVVRMRFPKNELADGRVWFSRDGSRAVTTHRLPLMKLLGVSTTSGVVLADILLWEQESRPWMSVGGQIISEDGLFTHDGCPRFVQLWNLPEGKREHSWLLPAFTTTNSLNLSPCGRWLVRTEPILWGYGPVEPKEAIVCNGQTGEMHHLPSPAKDGWRGYYQAHVTSAGMHLTYARQVASGSFSPPVVQLEIDVESGLPIFAFPSLKQVAWRGSLAGSGTNSTIPMRTVDGMDVALVENGKNVEVARVDIHDGEVKVLSKPVSIEPGNGYHLMPLSQPGQVLVTWLPMPTNQFLYDLASKIHFNLQKYLPQSKTLSASIVDIHQSRIVWNGTLTVPAEHYNSNLSGYGGGNQTMHLLNSSPQFTTTTDQQAVWACYAVGNDFHLFRWPLPLRSYSAWWSAVAGALTFVLTWRWLKRRANLVLLPSSPPVPAALHRGR